jgi:hypothetical protein
MLETAEASAVRPVAVPLASRAAWPLVVTLSLLWATVALLVWLSVQRTAGHLIYALDDPYIHMAMAKNFALHGVWGVSSEGFTSSSSSIAWTALLALCFRIFGVRESIPFLLNLTFATITIVIASRLLRRRFPEASNPGIWLALTVLTFATPLPTLVFAGQEHILHVLCVIVFVFLAADLVSGPSVPLRSREFARVAALGVLLMLVRYEGAYPIVMTALFLAARRRMSQSLALVLCAALPIVIYGAISVARGWWWAPNSVVLKGNLPDWTTLGGLVHLLGSSGFSNLSALPVVAILIYAALGIYAWRLGRESWHPTAVMLTMFVGIALMHLQYSQPRAFWLYRYEAYVVASGIMVVAAALFTGRWFTFERIYATTGGPGTVALVALLLLSPLTERALKSPSRALIGTQNIYEQQYQMGLFLREYYAGSPVALNDIGAPTFFADIRLLDLVGLASMDIARFRRAQVFSSLTLDDVARDQGIRVAIVYDDWFPGGMPRRWLRAGTWTIKNAVVVGGDTVAFYAVDRGEYSSLVAHLQEFAPRLPPGVTSTIGR